MRYIQLFLLSLFIFANATFAVKFTVDALPKGAPARCIRDFVNKGKMVVVKVNSSGSKGEGQVLNLMVSKILQQTYNSVTNMNDRFTTIRAMNMAEKRI